MPLTQGHNAQTQAEEIRSALKTALAALGLATFSRGRFEVPPSLPAIVMLGPEVTTPLGQVACFESRYEWTLVYLRRIGQGEEREALLDAAADAIMDSIAELMLKTPHTSFEFETGEGPNRLYIHQIPALLDRLEEDVDAAVITFSTRRYLLP